MARFSERTSVRKPREVLQLGGADQALRTALWNVTFESVRSNSGVWQKLARKLAVAVLNVPADAISYEQGSNFCREVFRAASWELMFDCLEHIVELSSQPNAWLLHGIRDTMADKVNVVLEGEGSGYRFVKGQLAPITGEIEIAEIERAAAEADRLGLKGVTAHLDTALAALSQKREPDYRTSIKESISAVESAVSKIMGRPAAGLADAMKDIVAMIPMHPALAQGFIKLYGYTSNEEGVRHAILDDPDRVGYDEAKFMLVACSAFVNFLISKANAAGVEVGGHSRGGQGEVA